MESSLLNYFPTYRNAYGAYSKAPASPTGPTVTDPNLKTEAVVVAKGLRTPTSMAFIGPNDILVLEKNTGVVKRIVDGKVLPKPVLNVAVARDLERGLLGIAISRNNNTSEGQRYVFLYYTESGGGNDGDDIIQKIPPLGNRLYRYELINNELVNPVLFLDLPAIPGTSNRAEHNGGKVIIGPDEDDDNVYVGIGEVGGRRTRAENVVGGPTPDGTGGILRITQEGSPVLNGLLGKKFPLNLYYAYGIRNTFGMDFDPITRTLWDTENGPAFGDEINMVEPGFNSGWFKIQGYAKDAELGVVNPSTDLVKMGKKSHYDDPKFVWATTVAPTALKFLNSDKLGSKYENDMFVGDINNGYIYHFKLNEDRNELLNPSTGEPFEKNAITPEQLPSIIFGKGFGGITDLQVGPDGYLYVLTYAGAIFRIVPVNDTSYPDASVNAKANTNTLSSPSPTTKGTGAATHTVSIVGVRGDKSYIPNPIDIKVGDTVTWKNTDQISHTVTSGTGPTDPAAGKSFDSHVLLSNGGIFSHQFNEPGTYSYYCIFHPTMIGSIDVVAKTTTTNQLPRQQQGQEQQPGSQTTGIPGVVP